MGKKLCWGLDGDDDIQKWRKFEPYEARGKKGKRANKRKRGKTKGEGRKKKVSSPLSISDHNFQTGLNLIPLFLLQSICCCQSYVEYKPEKSKELQNFSF